MIDVLVVGAGPTGMVLALDLARRGHSVRLIDRASQRFGGSRAKGLQPRSLEVLADLGVIDDVLAGGSSYPPLRIHLRRLHVRWRMGSVLEPMPDVPYPNTWMLPQFRMVDLLGNAVESHGVAVEHGQEFVGLSQSRGGVSARVAGPAGEEVLAARYVVGADGGASSVRHAIGVGFAGSTDDDDRIVIADARIRNLSRDSWHIWPGFKGRFIGACPLPGGDMFQLMVRLARGDEPAVEAAELTSTLQTRSRNANLVVEDVSWKSIFRPNTRLADSYRVGRVFLAGDAAHVHPPAGAQGLNTGIQDAYNLGWKLSQVLNGAHEHLLATYEAERRPVAAAVLGLSAAKYRGLGRFNRASLKRGTEVQQLGVTYAGGPLAFTSSDRSATLSVGDRAPDAILRGPTGQVRLHELLQGPNFTLIAYGVGAARQLTSIDWVPGGAQLTRIRIDGGPLGALSDATFTDVDDSFRHAYGVSRRTLILIRPDGYIGYVAIDSPGEGFGAAVEAMTPARLRLPQ